MTTDDDIDTSPPAPSPAHRPAEPRRHSTAVVVGAGVAGALIGAFGTIAAIAFAWLISAGPPGPPGPPPMMAFHHGPPPPPMGGPMGGFGFGPPPGPPAPPPGPPGPPPPPSPHS